MNKRIINYLSTFSLIIFLFILIALNYLDIFDYTSPDNYFLFLVIPFILFLSLFITCEKKIRKETLILILLLYSIFLLSIILNNQVHSVTFNGYRFGNINLIPFKSIIETIKDIRVYGASVVLGLIFEIFKFLPFVIFLPLVSNKFKKWYLIFPVIIFLSVFYECLEYALGLGVLDIDDFILNVSFSLLFYLLIRKTKIKDFISKILLDFTFKEDKFGIENNFFTLKINRQFMNIIYYILFSVFLFSLTINLMTFIPSLGNKVTVSGLINCSNPEYLVTEYRNYRFYSTCKGDYDLVINNIYSMSLDSYILSRNGNISSDVSKKFHIRKEEVIKNIKVKENNLLGKVKIKNNVYFYNIEDISFQKDNIEYKSYKDYLNFNKYLSYYEILGRVLENIYSNHDFTISKGKYFNKLTCYDKDISNEYYLPLKYKITDKTCKFLSKI